MAGVLWKRRGRKGSSPLATLLDTTAEEMGRQQQPERSDDMKFLRSVKDVGWTAWRIISEHARKFYWQKRVLLLKQNVVYE
jgi:hypothetical protein